MGTLSDKVVRYVDFIHDMSNRAKQPGYSRADWEPLRHMVADDFVRVGRHGEVQDWEECVNLMYRWAGVGQIDSTVLRCVEIGSKVFYEINEKSNYQGVLSEFNTISVVTFDDRGLIRRYEFYQ